MRSWNDESEFVVHTASEIIVSTGTQKRYRERPQISPRC